MSGGGLALALAVMGAACSHEASSRREPAARPASAATTIDAGVDAGSPCVERCVRDRQMVATSIEAIMAACQRECAATR